MKQISRLFSLSLLLILSGCSSPYLQLYGLVDSNGSDEEMKAVIDRPEFDPNAERGKNWVPPLCGLADSDDRHEVLSYLIDKGANINSCYDGYLKNAPLHIAAEADAANNIRVLLARGADPTQQDFKQRTPLDIAIAEGNRKAIDLLNADAQARAAWTQARQADTSAAYTAFIAAYPNSSFASKAQSALSDAQQREEKQRQMAAQLRAMEQNLPPEMVRDKYMVSLSQYLKQGDYAQALPLFKKLERLPIATDPSLDFFYGEALLRTNQPGEALQKLYRYINTQGSGAAHYARALQLINEAEAKL